MKPRIKPIDELKAAVRMNQGRVLGAPIDPIDVSAMMNYPEPVIVFGDFKEAYTGTIKLEK